MANLVSNRTASRILDHLEKKFPPPCSHKTQPHPSSSHRQHPWYIRYDNDLEKFIIFIPQGSLCGYSLDLSNLEACVDLDEATYPILSKLQDWYVLDGIVPDTTTSTPPPYPLGECIVSFDINGTSAEPIFHTSTETIPATGAYLIATFKKRDKNSVTVHQLIQSAISLGDGLGGTLHRFEVSLTENGFYVAPGSLFSVDAEGLSSATMIFTDFSVVPEDEGGGWNCNTTPSDGDRLCIVANEDGTASLALVSALDSADIIFTIATFLKPDSSTALSVVQRTFSDLYSTRSFATLPPWTIQCISGVWSVWSPQWLCSPPRASYPEGWTPPQPETISTASTFPDVAWYPITDFAPSSVLAAGQHVYAGLADFSGAATLIISTEQLTESPFRVYLGYFFADASHPSGLGFVQIRAGAITSAWSTTNPAWVVVESGGDIRYEDPPALSDGSTIWQKAYWLHTTSLAGKVYLSAEVPTSLEEGVTTTQEAYALEYIYRHDFFFSPSTETIFYNEQAYPVPKRSTKDFAQFISQPFVERVQVTYPETPLDQGSVDAVNKQVKILASMEGVEEAASTSLFATETIDITETSPHQGV